LEFETIEGVRRVESIATIPSIVAGPGDSLRTSPAIEDEIHSHEAARDVAEVVRRDRVARKGLVSKDERSFAINIRLTGDVDADRSSMIEEISERIAKEQAWYSGVPVFRTEVNRQARKELAMYVPGTLLLVFCVMWFAFRSLAAAFLTLVSAGIGAWIVIGVMGLAGRSISLSTMTLPSIVLALGCAYVTHVLAAARGVGSRVELELAILRVSRAVGLSGLTTAIGYLAMATVRIQAIRELGTFGSLGSLVVMGAALTFVPAVLGVGPKDVVDGLL
jgi:predicted RND superfamily exporter protein